jgi:transmembrane sensor
MPKDQFQIPESLQQDAWAWVSQLNSGSATQWDAHAFRRWRDASPLHQAAFVEAREQWRMLQPALQDLLNTNEAVANYHRQVLKPPRVDRRMFLCAAAGVTVAAGVSGMAVFSPLGLWPKAEDWNADYHTATGEQRTLALAEQIKVTLNTRSSIRHLDSADGADVLDLTSGEAAFDVPSVTRAFSVMAGAGCSIATAANFEVKHLEGRTRVTCINGNVRVVHPAGERLLQAQQMTVYNDQSISSIASFDPDEVSAWRRGELVFHQKPLGAVLDEINRYRPGRVVLMANSVREKTLSARFRLDQLDVALLQIQRSFELTSQTLPAGVLVLS